MDGFINLYKPEGISSQKAITLVKKLLRVKKIGHSGTLDPAAVGVLPVALGKATRLTEYIMDLPKSYRAEITFGKTTDTQDREGKVLSESDCSHVTTDDLLAVLPNYKGEIAQVPPMVSALKFQGQPLYKLARKGQVLDRPARKIKIYDLRLLATDWQMPHPKAVLDIVCSRGTYIRTICHDLGCDLGVGAYMSALERTSVGGFSATEAITLAELTDRAASGDESFIIPMERVVRHLPQIKVDATQASALIHGRVVPFGADPQDDYFAASCVLLPDAKLLGIGHLFGAEGQYFLQMDKVFLTPPQKGDA